MKVNIKLGPGATLPTYANPGDAGLDLTATSLNRYQDFFEYGTQVYIEIPENHVGLLFPRSSISKKDLRLCNSVGVIDSSFRGEVKLRFKSPKDCDNVYMIGERIGQLVILPYPQIELKEVDELDESIRGVKGFGSSNFEDQLVHTKAHKEVVMKLGFDIIPPEELNELNEHIKIINIENEE